MSDNIEMVKVLAKEELLSLFKKIPKNMEMTYDSYKILIELVKSKFEKCYGEELGNYLLASIYNERVKDDYDIAVETRLSKKLLNSEFNTFNAETEKLIKKWDAVLLSFTGAKLSKKQLGYAARLLENQFKVNKGYFPESSLIITRDAELQNYALPVIRKITPLLINSDTENLCMAFSAFTKDEIYVKKIVLESGNIRDIISSESTTSKVYSEFIDKIVSAINHTIEIDGGLFTGRLIFSIHEKCNSIFYMRFILGNQNIS